MTYMKDSFEKWLSQQKSVNGKSYSKETVLNYVKALKSYSAKLQNISLTETDLFNIDNSKDFELTTELIKNSDNYSTINDTYHRIFSSALNAYQKFLDDSSNSKSDNTDYFIQWLKNSKFWRMDVFSFHRNTECMFLRNFKYLIEDREQK